MQITLKTSSSSDDDFYKLMQYYNSSGILLSNEYLLAELRNHVEARFGYMTRSNILKYCNFLKDLGMFFEDKDLILKLETYFNANYYLFELNELFQMQKLIAYSFYQPDKFQEMLEDSIAVRVKDKE